MSVCLGACKCVCVCDTHNCVLKISNAVNGRRWWRLHCRCIYRCHLAIRNSNCMHMCVCVCATIKRFHLYYLIKIQYRSNSEFISIDKNNNKKKQVSPQKKQTKRIHCPCDDASSSVRPTEKLQNVHLNFV